MGALAFLSVNFGGPITLEPLLSAQSASALRAFLSTDFWVSKILGPWVFC